MDVYGRVARSLLEFAVNDGQGNKKIREKISRQDLAKMVGASREMVSRVMKDLQTSGHIRVDKRRIVLLSDMEVSSKKIREQARKAWNFKV